jgi:hypothetical protein
MPRARLSSKKAGATIKKKKGTSCYCEQIILMVNLNCSEGSNTIFPGILKTRSRVSELFRTWNSSGVSTSYFATLF